VSEVEDELSIGYVAGPHGIRGGLRVRLANPDSQALAVGRQLTLRDDRGRARKVAAIIRVTPQPGRELVRVWLEGVEDRDAADALRGLEVRVPRGDLPQLERDEYYLADAIGSQVVRELGGSERQSLGTVVGLTSNGVQDLFEVEWQSAGRGARIWLLPALPQFIAEIDEGEIVADLPEGFLPTELEGTPGDAKNGGASGGG